MIIFVSPSYSKQLGFPTYVLPGLFTARCESINIWNCMRARLCCDLHTSEFIARLSKCHGMIAKIGTTLGNCDIIRYHICRLHLQIYQMYLQIFTVSSSTYTHTGHVYLRHNCNQVTSHIWSFKPFARHLLVCKPTPFTPVFKLKV